MKTSVDQLEEVIRTEDDLAQALLEAMEQQQQAIVQFQAELLAQTSERARELAKLMETLEKERWALVAEITGCSPSLAAKSFRSDVSAAELLGHLDPVSASRIRLIIDQMRSTANRIIRVNENNRRLLEHARRFVQETLRVVTDNYSQQFIDQKM